MRIDELLPLVDDGKTYSFGLVGLSTAGKVVDSSCNTDEDGRFPDGSGQGTITVAGGQPQGSALIVLDATFIAYYYEVPDKTPDASNIAMN